MQKLKVGILGATGLVGQMFITLLANHPWFEVTELIASERSVCEHYEDIMQNRWRLPAKMPQFVRALPVSSATDIAALQGRVDLIFCAINMEKTKLIALEEKIAKLEIPVVSNNSANRGQADVPMLIPEINAEHVRIIDVQRQRLGTKKGFIAVKPNCSIQSYVPALTPLLAYEPQKVFVSTYQAVSGAGKMLPDFPEIVENVIPYIAGEEAKSELEPLKIWGELKEGEIINAVRPLISAQCYRVPVEFGHIASVAVKFNKKPAKDDILRAWENYETLPQKLELPSAPKPFVQYLSEADRPQPKLDAMFERGMGITVGRLREDNIFDYKFACLSHNLIRGAAGGAILTAELLSKLGYIG